MKRIIGEVIQEGNIYIDGQGYLGVVRNLKLPDIEQEMIETKGVLGANYSSGVLKPLEISFKLAVVDPVLYAAFFHTTFSEIKAPLLFRESVHKGGKNYGISAEFLGEFISISESDHESGKEVEAEIKMAVRFYMQRRNNIPIITYDHKNTILMINGVDMMSDVRSNLTL
ncbi:phage major tail tube protein, putative [Campylobacter jejuni subsp. jejuni LMG 9879]|uniref:phage major tail tube protein n=1 Tax=Campylobacter jejuni TaxID=197 RepID=UPI0002581945|nr:phage major tail tube protein [Campylobacter jejuni]EIB34999.1 phage major tail tube protein, putative [Campylobacter jejuni subsp. jejuni LMG 9879]